MWKHISQLKVCSMQLLVVAVTPVSPQNDVSTVSRVRLGHKLNVQFSAKSTFVSSLYMKVPTPSIFILRSVSISVYFAMSCVTGKSQWSLQQLHITRGTESIIVRIYTLTLSSNLPFFLTPSSCSATPLSLCLLSPCFSCSFFLLVCSVFPPSPPPLPPPHPPLFPLCVFLHSFSPLPHSPLSISFLLHSFLPFAFSHSFIFFLPSLSPFCFLSPTLVLTPFQGHGIT